MNRYSDVRKRLVTAEWNLKRALSSARYLNVAELPDLVGLVGAADAQRYAWEKKYAAQIKRET